MRGRDLALGVYVLVCAASLVWPLYGLLGNRVEPFVLGLPLSFAYNIGWVLLTFFVLLGYHLTSGEEG